MTDAPPPPGRQSQVPTEIGILHLDAAFRIRRINRRATEIAGRPARALLGHCIWSLWPEALGSDAEAALRRAMAAGLPAALTHRHQTLRGARWLNLRIVPRQAGGLALFVRDITEAKRAEAALSESSQRLAAIVANAPVGLSEISLDGRFLKVNEELCRILGRGEAEVLRLSVSDVTSPEDRAESERIFGTVVRTGQPGALDKRYVRPDGNQVWANSRLTRLDDLSGRPRAVLAVTADLTARKQLEAHLIESEARTRTLAEGIPQLVWRISMQREAIWLSPQWTRQTGQSFGEGLGTGWLKAIHPDDREATIAAWRTAAVTGLFAVEHRIVMAGNGYRWCQSRAVLRQDPSGAPPEWLGTSTDIEDQVRLRQDLARARDRMESLVAERTAELRKTLQALRSEAQERERAEEALRHTQKLEAIGQLTGGIAHDFNNMLQGITGSINMAQQRIRQQRAAEATLYLDTAQDVTRRAAALTRRLLAFARRQRLEPRPLDPNLLITELHELVRRTMGPAITVELHMQAPPGSSVLCDPSELENALLNLCINARDAMPQGGRLVLATAQHELREAELAQHDAGRRDDVKPGAYIEIAITDTGTGMTRRVLDRAFEPFFTTKPQGQGTGLGLSQVYGFVHQSGGVVRIESKPGRGTTIRLLLPRQDAPVSPAEPPPADARPAHAASGQVILLVDDETSVRMPAAEHLRGLGYLVVEAEDGPGAIRAAAGLARLDLLVTDVGLTGRMDGRQVAELVGARWPHLPVLYITGHAGVALPPGANVLGKPFDLDALAVRVQAAALPPVGGRG